MSANYTRQSLLFVVAASTVFLINATAAANETNKDAPQLTDRQHVLPPMQVVAGAVESLDQGKTSYRRSLIQTLPSGNGDITSVLKLHPNVQFDDKELSSKTPGEIDPANISINGADYWQNLFLLDGVSINNDLDPVSNNPVHMTSVPGRSQGLALDTDLLDSIEAVSYTHLTLPTIYSV